MAGLAPLFCKLSGELTTLYDKVEIHHTFCRGFTHCKSLAIHWNLYALSHVKIFNFKAKANCSNDRGKLLCTKRYGSGAKR